MFGLGFYSKHTSQRGLMWGVAAGFLSLAYAGFLTDLAWPWYCALGGVVSIAVAWSASLLLDGRQADWHPYSVVGSNGCSSRRVGRNRRGLAADAGQGGSRQLLPAGLLRPMRRRPMDGAKPHLGPCAAPSRRPVQVL